MNEKRPLVLSVAGSDPSGGAGIELDLKVFQALGCHGMAVATALTAQNSGGVLDVHNLSAQKFGERLRCVSDDMPPQAFKIGMLATTAILEELLEIIETFPQLAECPIVLDPVLVSSSHYTLLETRAVDLLVDQLLPLCALITPNQAEAKVLLGLEDSSRIEPNELALRLLDLGVAAALVTGGDGQEAPRGEAAPESEAQIDDEFCSSSRVQTFSSPRLEGGAHGTGCALSSAIAASLAQGRQLEDAIELGRGFVWNAIRRAVPMSTRHGAVPYLVF